MQLNSLAFYPDQNCHLCSADGTMLSNFLTNTKLTGDIGFKKIYSHLLWKVSDQQALKLFKNSTSNLEKLKLKCVFEHFLFEIVVEE